MRRNEKGSRMKKMKIGGWGDGVREELEGVCNGMYNEDRRDVGRVDKGEC